MRAGRRALAAVAGALLLGGAGALASVGVGPPADRPDAAGAAQATGKPSFAGPHDTTGLARASEVLTELQERNPQAPGLAVALEQVTANAEDHATGGKAGVANGLGKALGHAKEHQPPGLGG